MTAVLLALLAASPSTEPVKLATVTFARLGLESEAAEFYSEHLAARLAEDPRLRVTTPRDLAVVLGNERQRQLLACSGVTTSCLAELAGALGVDGLVTGQLAKVGAARQLNVKVLAADGSRTLYVHSSALLQSDEDLIAALNVIARAAADTVVRQLRPDAAPVAVVEAPRAKPTRWAPWALMGGGALAAAFGVGFTVDANAKYARLSDAGGWPGFAPDEGERLVQSGQMSQLLGITLLAAGGVCIAGAALWLWLDRPAAVVTLSPTPSGATIVLTGIFP